jgi:hypothetical protein
MGAGPGGVLSYMGAERSGRAAGRAAREAEAEARRQRTEAVGEARRVEGNATSIQELQALDKQLGLASRMAEQDQKLLDSIDPALMEASSQVLNLLRGDQSSIGGTLEKQRMMQRQKLLASLREQLGPGAETSTAGIQALSRFDSETSSLSAGTQQQSLGSLMGILGQGSQYGARGMNALGMSAQGFGDRSTRMLQGGQGVVNAMLGTGQNIVDTAGSRHVSAQMSGRAMQQAGNQWQEMDKAAMEAGASMGSAMMGSDVRLKTDITQLPDQIWADVPTYHYRYKDEKFGSGWHFGVMAQDLLALDPKHPAVFAYPDGYYRVDYSKLEKVK